MDWLSVIDIKQALDNCRTDIIGDWFYDPWGWPELAWIANEQDGQQLARSFGWDRSRASFAYQCTQNQTLASDPP